MSPVIGSDALKPDAHSSPVKQFHIFAILLAAGCLTTMTGGIVSPVFPEMVEQLQFDPEWAGLLVSIHNFATALFTPLMGILADRVGKLRVMIPCLLLYAIFGVFGAFIPNLAVLLLIRVLLGIASSGIAAACIGLLGNMYEGDARSRVLGYATSAMTTTSILVPLLGGWVGKTHWQYAFYLYALSLPLAVAAVVGLREPRDRQSSLLPGSQTQQLVKLIRQPSILRLYLLLAAAALIVNAVVVYTPLYLKQAIGAGPELNGTVLAIRGVGAVIFSAIFANRVAKHIGAKAAIALGFSLMSFTIITIPFLSDLRWIIPTAFLFGAGFGLITPNTYNSLASLAPSEVRASILAIGTGFNSLGLFISPLILGQIWDNVGPTTAVHISQLLGRPMSAEVADQIGLTMVFYVAGAIALATAALTFVRTPKKIKPVR
jgi:MFS transporter, ACDE family, multidrug resistance protein